ncbi:type II toxin-antitoxin system RelE/ParE family toxin [Pseudomonas sp. C9-3]|uniref:type II toxin-antitoxin system RelE/ParE family toxin n=1 Tax=Pseudomonas sp. C9-3 TaxID=3078264 RepID=UPI0028EECC9A|nr:type II toxin-antitoxin system RelE/ParE family toxin [Pseudomonas sp. C9-3]
MKLKVLFNGRWRVVSPMEPDGRSQVEIFMDELAANFNSNVAGLVRMMEIHSESGSDEFNTKQCHYVDQGECIYEYIKGRLRVFWFEDDDRVVVCTHGIIKKDQKTPKREVERSIRAKRLYLSAKERNELEFIEEDDDESIS